MLLIRFVSVPSYKAILTVLIVCLMGMIATNMTIWAIANNRLAVVFLMPQKSVLFLLQHGYSDRICASIVYNNLLKCFPNRAIPNTQGNKIAPQKQM